MIDELYNLVKRFTFTVGKPTMKLERVDTSSAYATNITMSTYPDFSDAYIEEMRWKNGKAMTVEEIEEFTDLFPDEVYDIIYDCCL